MSYEGEVFSVGVVPEMATTARLRLTRNGYQNVHVKLGEGNLIICSFIANRTPPPPRF